MRVVHQAIRAGIFNDLGSGSNVDLCVITRAGAQMHRNYEIANVRAPKQAYEFPIGTTPVWRNLSALVTVEDATMEE